MRLEFEKWKRDGTRFRHHGHSIFLRDEGTGPALLVLHGFPSASWDFHPIWPELTSRFRVIAPDFIGFGWSDKPRHHAYSIDDQATLVETLAGSLGVTRAHVLAHDYGDSVAQELLARHEARGGAEGLKLESLCLLNGGLFPEAHRPRTIQKILASPIGDLVSRFVTKRTFASGMRAIFGRGTPPSEELLDELWTLLAHQDGARVTPRLIGYMAERRRARRRWVGAMRATRVPMRFIVGGADPVSGEHMAERYAEIVPSPDVVLLPRIGHYPQVEDPARVASEILAFHDRLATAAS